MALGLAVALVLPVSTSALPTDISDDAPRRADAPSASTVWDRPAASEPVIVVRPPQPPSAVAEPERGANPLWAIPLASLSSTRERPIFSPSRRPPPPAVAAPPVVQPPPQQPKPPRVERPPLSLVGTVAGDTESFGIFVDQTTRAALRLKIGEGYQGWKLRAVQGREATLERDQQSMILSLPQPGAVAPGQKDAKPAGTAASRTVESAPQRDERR
jgi:general secretion pathway protein N